MSKINMISWIALVLSIIACIITLVRIDVYITNDTFVGIMAGFMGICATILLGAQIYNSIDTRNSINKLNESFNSKIDKLNITYDNRMRELNVLNNKMNYDLTKAHEKLEEYKNEIEELALLTKRRINFSNAIALSTIQPYSSYKYFFECLKYEMKKQNPEGVQQMLSDLRLLVQQIKEITPQQKIFTKDKDIIKDLNFDALQEFPLSSFIKDEYNSIHSDIMSIIHERQKI